MARSPNHDEEPLVRIAARRAVQRLRSQATTPALGRFLWFQASGAAGDALIALALADSLFFSVPSAEARGRVALYLAFTVAPFAVVGPFLSSVLDRHRGSMRIAMVVAAFGRGLLAWLLATRLESAYLFPLAFGILMLSRAALVVRGAMLPSLVKDEDVLVQTNSAISKIGALAGIVAVLPGILFVKAFSTRVELLFTSAIYLVGTFAALGLPKPRGRHSLSDRLEARRAIRSTSMRRAVMITTGIRFLVGFLVFHLAFAFRREDSGSVELGLLIASAATGALAGAIVAPRLRRRMREEGMLVACAIIAGLAGLGAGYWFSVTSAAVLVFVFGMASGAAKVAFDAIVQRATSEGGRGWVFARFESILQLAWVLGALIPLLIALPSGPGVVGAGFFALGVAIIFAIGRRRTASPALP